MLDLILEVLIELFGEGIIEFFSLSHWLRRLLFVSALAAIAYYVWPSKAWFGAWVALVVVIETTAFLVGREKK